MAAISSNSSGRSHGYVNNCNRCIVSFVVLEFLQHVFITNTFAEFIPYVFQILAKLLEANPSNALSDNYKSLMGPILSVQIWETRGIVPGCARLLCAVIHRGSQFIGNDQLVQILGIFQRLIQGKKTQPHGFDILDAIFTSLSP